MPKSNMQDILNQLSAMGSGRGEEIRPDAEHDMASLELNKHCKSSKGKPLRVSDSFADTAPFSDFAELRTKLNSIYRKYGDEFNRNCPPSRSMYAEYNRSVAMLHSAARRVATFHRMLQDEGRDSWEHTVGEREDKQGNVSYRYKVLYVKKNDEGAVDDNKHHMHQRLAAHHMSENKGFIQKALDLAGHRMAKPSAVREPEVRAEHEQQEEEAENSVQHNDDQEQIVTEEQRDAAKAILTTRKGGKKTIDTKMADWEKEIAARVTDEGISPNEAAADWLTTNSTSLVVPTRGKQK